MPIYDEKVASKGYNPTRIPSYKYKNNSLYSRPMSRERKAEPVATNSTLETKATLRDSALTSTQKPDFIKSHFQLKKARQDKLLEGPFTT